jgi:hypothetical protein
MHKIVALLLVYYFGKKKRVALLRASSTSIQVQLKLSNGPELHAKTC